MSAWFYARGGEQCGPFTPQQLRDLLASSQLQTADLVWTEGMSDWRPMGQIAELSATGTAVQPEEAIPTATRIGYYGTGGMPARAAANLRGHALPSGDVGTWPLDDSLFAQMQNALKLRKRIYSAAQLYRSLLFLSVIVTATLLLVALFTVTQSGSRAAGIAIGMGMLVGAILCGFCALYWALWRFTMRSHRWAPLTFFIICLAGVAMNLLSMIFGAAGRDPLPVVLGGAFSMILAGIFAIMSWRAFAAIPKYLAQPAWCQELIAAAGL